jgi:DNA-binding NarL/FixJ family response regulator
MPPFMPPPGPLNVLLVGEDRGLCESSCESLIHALEDDESIGSVRVAGHGGRMPPQEIPRPDVVVFDAGPPAPDPVAMAGYESPARQTLNLVLASDTGEQTRRLADAVGAVGYLRKGSELASVAPVVLALTTLSSRRAEPVDAS